MTNQEIIEKINILKQELKEVKGTECSVYSRIVGYFEPVKQWNPGKTSEFHDRITFDVGGAK
jgi:ribonucleoside-triphosphate reductase